MHRHPDPALGDHAWDALRIVDRRHGMDDVADHPEERPHDGRDASDPEHPPVVSRASAHRPHLRMRVDSDTIHM